MKKIFLNFAFIAMFFVISCGGSENDNAEGSICNEGAYRCNGNILMRCEVGAWKNLQQCDYGCNYSTGQCNSSSNGGSGSGGSSSSGGGSSSECSYGQHKCDGNYSYSCSGGYWEYDEYCSNGCNYSTGKCKTSSSDGSSSGGGSTSECSSGEYRCHVNYSQRCSSGKWVDDQSCLGIGCNESTGKCKTQDEHKPCRPNLNGSVSSGSVKLSWSYTTSASCGTPTTTTLKVYDGEEWGTVESKNASSFKSYTLPASVWAYYSNSAGQYILRAGILVENEYGEASATCSCFIDDKNCSCI